jgi:hypothetical protein
LSYKGLPEKNILLLSHIPLCQPKRAKAKQLLVEEAYMSIAVAKLSFYKNKPLISFPEKCLTYVLPVSRQKKGQHESCPRRWLKP